MSKQKSIHLSTYALQTTLIIAILDELRARGTRSSAQNLANEAMLMGIPALRQRLGLPANQNPR